MLIHIWMLTCAFREIHYFIGVLEVIEKGWKSKKKRSSWVYSKTIFCVFCEKTTDVNDHVFWWDATEGCLYLAAISHCSKQSTIHCFGVQDINFCFWTCFCFVFFVFFLVFEPVHEHPQPRLLFYLIIIWKPSLYAHFHQAFDCNLRCLGPLLCDSDFVHPLTNLSFVCVCVCCRNCFVRIHLSDFCTFTAFDSSA